MSRWHASLPLIFAAALPALQAATPTPVQQRRLDDAVRVYEAGRFGQACSAFEALAREQIGAAQYNLAVMHLRGELPRPDRQLAEHLLEQAAANGFVTAMWSLGQALETGEIGRRDLAQAHYWYELAAEAGSVDAQVAMGTAYFLGRGRERDSAAAARWYREAAKGGDVGAQYLIASMYETGEGVERDLRLARYWYDIAARNGDDAAPGKVQEIDARLATPPR